jgi:hypothetical protein
MRNQYRPNRPARYVPCTCVAYSWPHRPGSGLCRWPDPPHYRLTTPPATKSIFNGNPFRCWSLGRRLYTARVKREAERWIADLHSEGELEPRHEEVAQHVVEGPDADEWAEEYEAVRERYGDQLAELLMEVERR